ncbi:MAG TPA: hypothetical protein VGM70_06580 [Pseudolysinimonas sp.]|jgi:hypothetical protein
MSHAIAIVAFLGAWLLFAGPLFQAYLELGAEEVDQASWEAADKAIPKPEGFSLWWWLLPPVAWFKQQARNRRHQQDVLKALDPHITEQAVSFFNKANGWLIVAGGASLLGVKETWELVETWDWPVWIFWVLIVLCPLLCVAYLVTRFVQSERMLGHEKPPRRRRPGRTPTATP